MTDTRQQWLVVLTTRDHAGDTAAIASVFSGRGLQIDSFIGFGAFAPPEGGGAGKIMLTFRAFAERCHSLCRILESLEAVTAVHCYDAEQISAELLQQAQTIKELLATMQ